MDFAIRQARVEDATTIAEFNAAMAFETEGKILDGATLSRGVEAVLADAAKGFYTVAEVAGEVVGQCLVTREWSDWRNGWFWWFQSVYVAEGFRRMGIFRAIFADVVNRAKCEGDVIGVRLYVEDENVRAQQTYAALGLKDENYRVLGASPLTGLRE